MIQVKHFQSERGERTPVWKDVEAYLNQYDLVDRHVSEGPAKPQAQILQMKAYPTGPHHNIVIILDVDEKPATKQV